MIGMAAMNSALLELDRRSSASESSHHGTTISSAANASTHGQCRLSNSTDTNSAVKMIYLRLRNISSERGKIPETRKLQPDCNAEHVSPYAYTGEFHCARW
jgi:hypothetical protein